VTVAVGCPPPPSTCANNCAVLTASWNDDKINYFRNLGGSPPTFSSQALITTLYGAWAVHAALIDGDELVDVVGTGQVSDSVCTSRTSRYDSTGTNFSTSACAIALARMMCH
jgi:hypothetical protein